MAPASIRLLLRHYAAVRGPILAVALVTATLAGFLAVAPTIFARLAAQEITQSTASAPTAARYLIGRPAGRILPLPSQDPAASGLGDLDPIYGAWHDQLTTVHDELPESLRSHVGSARWSTTYPAVGVGASPAATPPSAQTSISTVLDLHPQLVARLAAGSWPHGAVATLPLTIAVSADAAATLGVAVGSELGSYRVTGIFEPLDPNADYWLLNPGMLRANVDDDGNLPVRITATAFVAPEQAGLQPVGSGGFTGVQGSTLVWLPLRLADISPSSAQRILTQLGGVAAAPRPMPPHIGNLTPDIARGAVQELSLSADIIAVLSDSLGRIDAASAVLQVALGGPLIAIAAVLIAGLMALLRRGRPATALLAMRGAGSGRIRRYWAGLALVAGLPAAICAVLSARLIFGAQTSTIGMTLGALVGVVPAMVLALAPRPVIGANAVGGTGSRAATAFSRRPGRRSVPTQGTAAGPRWRPIAEGTALLLAAASTYLLLAAGLGAAHTGPGAPTSAAASVGGSGSGSDIFVVAAPALLIAAASIVVLRCYRVPLRAIAAWARSRRGAVGFVGSLRAVRDPIGAVVPVIAILAGVAVAGLSATLIATIDGGTQRAALAGLGAPIRVTDTSGAGISDADYARINALDTVAGAARFGRVAMASAQIPGRPTKPTVEVLLADLAELPTVQFGVPDAVPAVPATALPPPAAPGTAAPAPLNGVGSSNLGPEGSAVTIGSADMRLAATAVDLPGITRSRTFLLLDSTVTAFGPFRPQTMLVAPATGADTASVAAAVIRILGPQTTVDTAADSVAELRTGAMATGMRLALRGALIAAAAATVAALVISVLAATRARARLMAVARILGLTRRQRRSLIVWEQAPVAIAALIGGAGLALGLAALVHTAIDLAPFTGGALTPPLAFDWPAMGSLLSGFVVVVVFAIAAGIALTRRTTSAMAIKLDEE